MKKPTTTVNDQINDFLKSYFKLLDIDVEIQIKDEDEEIINVNILTKGSEAGLLIGNKGRNLYSLQSILNLVLRKYENQKKIIIDIDQWKEKNDERLKLLADKTAEKALSSGEKQTLYNLSPSQRRTVHMHLAENKKIKTESFGEGGERYLVVTPA